MIVNIDYYLILGIFLFFIGFLGISYKRNNFIRVLLSLQIIILGILLCFAGLGDFMEDRMGEAYGFITLLVSIGEALLFLGISYAYFRKSGDIEIEVPDKHKERGN